ncbi:hypothetical protein Bpfe_013494 [Biomphalaria pfeifferi]|uniref:Uncharacterized protein n=1 Tax=Biomphalaria pfeifferi TaxID=112525 RepID=A0AAD8BM74_BIOPF|nr:hypothetical protein Bpfe_013494 [Biomphalaria pfeifferi]
MNDYNTLPAHPSPTNFSDVFYTTQRMVTASAANARPTLTAEKERTFFICYINPSVSSVSLLLSLLSVMVFVKSGLRNPKNIFFFALSFADTMSQAMSLNFAQILRYFGLRSSVSG